MNAKLQIRQRQMVKTAKFQFRQHRYKPNLTFDFGGYDYWRLWILADAALAVLKFGVCGYRPVRLTCARTVRPLERLPRSL